MIKYNFCFKKKQESKILQITKNSGETKAVLSAPRRGNKTVEVPTEPRNDHKVE